MTSHSSSASDQDEGQAYPTNMASSLAGLPVRPQANGDKGAPAPAPAGTAAPGLKDFLDLAVSSIPR